MLTVLDATIVIASLVIFTVIAKSVVFGGVFRAAIIVIRPQMLLRPFDTLVEFCSSRLCSYSDIQNTTHTPRLRCTT